MSWVKNLCSRASRTAFSDIQRTEEKSTGTIETQLYAKIKEFERQLHLPYVNKENEARVIALALVAKEHIIFVGEPGTAKSALAIRAGELTESRFFKKQLSKYTAPEELFGPIDIRALKRKSIYRTISRGMIQEAEIAFIDEVFRGGSAIRDTLLSVMNERKLFNGEKTLNVPMRSVISATNFVSYDEEDQAFYDRFLLRSFLSSLDKSHWPNLLNATFDAEFKGTTKVSKPVISNIELDKLYDMILGVDTSRITGLLNEIIADAKDKHNITISDRRIGKSLKMIAANAVIEGRKHAMIEDLSILRYIIPADEEQFKIISNKLDDIISPINHMNRIEKLNSNLVSSIGVLREDSTIEVDFATEFSTIQKARERAKEILKVYSESKLRNNTNAYLRNLKEYEEILKLLENQRKEKLKELVVVERDQVAS